MRHTLQPPTRVTAVLSLLALGAGAAASTHGLKPGHLPLPVVQSIAMPDLDALIQEDLERDAKGQPLRFAIPNTVSISPATHGTWEQIDRNRVMWRLRVVSEGAAHLNFGFGQFHLPPSTDMTIYSADGFDVCRSITADSNPDVGQLWTRIIHGEDVVIEATVDAKHRDAFESGVLLTSINQGYRGLGAPDYRGSSESCNIDVVCSEGDAWQNEIPSVGVYTLNGYLTCTGFMVNNTAQDQRPLFMTADHCGISNNNENSLVVYWNHQNSYCRTPGSGDSGGSGDGNWNQYTNGCNFLDDDSYYDSTLVELNSSPNASWGVTFAGWSRSNSASNGAGIHHPEAAEKRISFPDVTSNESQYWRVNWGEGRTAPGSSGSPLFDSNHRAIGTLCCGASYCYNDSDDYYGRGFAGAWSGMSAHLDPVGSNPTGIDTLVPGGGGDPSGACCLGTSCSYITEADCGGSGGSYLGDYVSCTGNPCDGSDPTGGCCVGTSCSVSTEAACEGTYLGDDTDCSGDPCSGGSCPDGEIEDCNGNCCPDYWVGDGYCDDGTYAWNGVPIYLNCDAFNCDGGDCDPADCGGGGDPTGGCCVGTSCSVETSADCAALGGTYLGDGSSCAGDPCGGGGTCPDGEIEDCAGNCCPADWVGDGFCDDGSFDWNGVPIYLNCDAFDCDGGDCDPADCGGGGGDCQPG